VPSESSKSIIIVPQRNYEETLEAFQHLKFTVKTSKCYFGGSIGDDSALEDWVKKKTKDWELIITDLASVCQKYPQSAYSGLQRLLQQEW
jgi:hypothetical protein